MRAIAPAAVNHTVPSRPVAIFSCPGTGVVHIWLVPTLRTQKTSPTPLATHTFPLASGARSFASGIALVSRTGGAPGVMRPTLSTPSSRNHRSVPLAAGANAEAVVPPATAALVCTPRSVLWPSWPAGSPKCRVLPAMPSPRGGRRGVPFVERVSVGGGGQREQDEAREQGEETAHPPKLSAPERARQGPNGQPIGRASSAMLGGDAGTSHLAHRFCVAAQTCVAARLATRDSRRRVTMRCAPLPITSARYARPFTPGKVRVGPSADSRRVAVKVVDLDHERVAGEAVPAAQFEPLRPPHALDREPRQRRARFSPHAHRPRRNHSQRASERPGGTTRERRPQDRQQRFPRALAIGTNIRHDLVDIGQSFHIE